MEKHLREGSLGYPIPPNDSEPHGMMLSHDSLFWLMIAIQLAGVLSCILTRLMEDTCNAAAFRHLFTASLFTVCAATVFCLYSQLSCWASCGATLSLMSVGAVLDTRGKIEFSSF